MILPPPTDYLRAFAVTFVVGLLSGLAIHAYGSWKYRRGKALRAAK